VGCYASNSVAYFRSLAFLSYPQCPEGRAPGPGYNCRVMGPPPLTQTVRVFSIFALTAAISFGLSAPRVDAFPTQPPTATARPPAGIVIVPSQDRPSIFAVISEAANQVSEALVKSTRYAVASTWASVVAGVRDATVVPARAVATTLVSISHVTAPFMYGDNASGAANLASASGNPMTRSAAAKATGGTAPAGSAALSKPPAAPRPASSALSVAGVTEGELDRRLSQLATALSGRFASLLRNPNSYGPGDFAGTGLNPARLPAPAPFTPASTYYGTVSVGSLQPGQAYSSFDSLPSSPSSDSRLLSVDSSTGLVGIGTTSPQYLLDVDGTARARFLIADSLSVRGSATSTFAAGIDLSSGCYAIGGNCLTQSAGTVTSISGSGGTSGLTLTGGPITTSGTLTLGGTLAAADGGTGSSTLSGILKGNGTGAVASATGDTDYQRPITLTTTGPSGAATFSSDTLNIPQYQA
jgi:hypothetical protein